jgi:hypothetical protein
MQVTRMLTLCGTHAQRGLILLWTQLKRGLSRLNRFGTKVTSWFRGLADDPDLVGIGFVLATLSSFGLLVFVITKLEGDDARQQETSSAGDPGPGRSSIVSTRVSESYGIGSPAKSLPSPGSVRSKSGS